MHPNRVASPPSYGGRDVISSALCSVLSSLCWRSFSVSCSPSAHLLLTLPGSLQARLCSPRTLQKWVWTAWLIVSTLGRRFHFVMLCTFLEAMSAPLLWVGGCYGKYNLVFVPKILQNHCLQYRLSVTSLQLTQVCIYAPKCHHNFSISQL